MSNIHHSTQNNLQNYLQKPFLQMSTVYSGKINYKTNKNTFNIMAHNCNSSSRETETQEFWIQDKLVLPRRPSYTHMHIALGMEAEKQIQGQSRDLKQTKERIKMSWKRGGGGELRGKRGHRKHTERKECHGASQDKLLQNHSAPAIAAQTFPYLNRSPRKTAYQVKMAVSSYRKQEWEQRKKIFVPCKPFNIFWICTICLHHLPKHSTA